MAVRIGNARLNEKNTTTGGAAGDQTGNEVCIQDWYKHSKGWVVYRPTDSAVAEKIAKDMEYACNNNKIGYCQTHRNEIFTQAQKYNYDCSKITVNCEADCSSTVRTCLAYAGIIVANFTTATEHSVLMATGKFQKLVDTKYTNSSDYLKRGDILVTQTKGHTAVVLDNGAKVTTSNTTTTTSAVSASAGTIVSSTDKDLNVRKTANGTVVGTLSYGECVKVVATEGNWYKIQYQNGYAYIYKSLVNVDSKNEVKYLAYVNDPELNVRKTAGGAVKLGTFGYNAVVGVISEEGNWRKIKYGDSYAYVHKDYLTKVSDSISFWVNVTDNDLNIRAKASSGNDSKILGTFKNHPNVRVYGTSGKYYKIKYAESDAYIYASLTKKI